ncbi:response regulator [Desulfobacterales bacterium HSG17]|nr:response regulator [Desulfobacterales bacterium HSG17]
MGIPGDQQEKIFESFQQLTGQKAGQYGGTGLGLSISKRLTEMMGGKISVISEIGKGSLFRLVFPGIKISDLQDKTIKSVLDKETDIIFDQAAILVADDINYNRDLIKNYLKHTDLTIIESENGRDTWELLQNQHIDLILTDIRMPEMDGYETADLLKKDDKFKNIPIVAMTASAMKEDAFKIESVFDGYLPKPLKRIQLIAVLKKYLPWKPIIESQAEKDTSAFFEPVRENILDKENISLEQKARLPELINILEKDFIPRWEEIRDVFFLDDISEFANKLKLVGEHYRLNFLKEYGENMYLRTENIEIDIIEKLIEEFPKLIEEIKKL